MRSISVLKTGFLSLLLAVSVKAGATQTLGQSVSVTLNQSLNHGDTLQVRKLLVDLLQGDNVTSIDLAAQALQPGAYLEIIVDTKVVGQLHLNSRVEMISLPLNLRNGIDYQRLLVRSIGNSYVQTLGVRIGIQNPGDPLPPLPPPPPLQPVPPPYNPGASLGGYCDDFDHNQFKIAKAFAYSSDGLNMNDANATNWGLNYNHDHACNTIGEYKTRFTLLRDMAYSSNGLNLTSPEAIRYALSKVEYHSSSEIQRMKDTLIVVRNFAYSSNGLNLTNPEASQVARQWIDRGYCEEAHAVQPIITQYQKEFNFAYSSNGLNYDRFRAKEYALSRIRNMSRCADIFR